MLRLSVDYATSISAGGADLRGAKGLSVEQLSKVKTLYLAKFDDEILEQIKTNLPELVGV